MSLTTGTKLGRYEIRSQIGAGGMGEVYLAQDTKLDRRVALKILPAEVAADRNRMSRFVQEAKAASALNHPNIITIHEIEQIDSVNLIATEFIDGETLRQRMRNAPVKLGEVLDVAAQIASALSAAHAAGIVHRDIKPENIMLRRDGIVKVLDFGLAKLSEKADTGTVDTEAATKGLVQTEPGVVMGTVAYMSPEQARGLAVDARTDIFSLGVVIYEMVAGQAPFGGATRSDLIVALLERDPPPLARFTPEAPAELERLVMKALAKDRDERYQTAKDLLIDLKRLRQKLEVDAEIERSVARLDKFGVPPSGGPVTDAKSSPTEGGTLNAHPTTSAEYIITEIKHHKRAVTVVLAGLVLLSLASIAYFFYFARSGIAIDSIAVLPFVNASADPNADYLSDGISETLINSLTQLQQLRVVARSTAFRYKGKEVDPRAVGRDLNVRAVLMGRVRQTGDSLNIQVDLVDATTGAQLWGQEYDRKISDVVVVKQDIAREVTEKLRLRLSGTEQRQLARRDTANPEAYQLYLKGRYYWNKRTAEGMKRAIEQFQQATDKDPNYALAYVGLADCYLLLEQYAGTPTSETLPKAKAAVLRALQIDDSLAEAHASLAKTYEHSWQFAEAGKEYKRAIELNPNYPTAHHWYSQYLVTTGRLDEALAEIKRAQQLDPLSTVISAAAASTYRQKGDLDAAIEQCKGIIELDPTFRFAHACLGQVYQKQGRYGEAIGEFRKAVEVTERASENLSALGHCYAISGRRSEAMATLKELEEKYAKRESAAFNLAAVYAGLGEKDQAFAWLEKDFQSRSGTLFQITFLPTFDTLRSDPRFADLLRRMELRP
jgi:serine/threonine protein kinase/Tfp pilus assembly protein PilF